MSTTALGIAPDSDGNGVTPLTHRKVQQYQWASTGVCGGLEVSGGTGLTYTVSEGMAVTTRGDSDGYTLAYFEGGTITTTAGNSSNPRYDVLWLSAHDISQGDDDNLVTLGVTNGTAAASPSIPSVDSDCTIIDTLLVPAGMTATSSCTSTGEIDYAVPYGAGLGLLGYAEQTTNAAMATSSTEYSTTVSFSVPTDRWIEVVYDVRTEAVLTSSWSYPDAAFNSGCNFQLYVDGVRTDSVDDKFPMSSYVTRQQISEPVFVEKGTHTVYWATRASVNSTYATHYWRGVRNTYVYDRGVGND